MDVSPPATQDVIRAASRGPVPPLDRGKQGRRMTIEYVPRRAPAGGSSWRTASGSAYVPAPLHTEASGGLGAVCVPVVPRRLHVWPFHWWMVVVVFVRGCHIILWGGPPPLVSVGVSVAA